MNNPTKPNKPNYYTPGLADLDNLPSNVFNDPVALLEKARQTLHGYTNYNLNDLMSAEIRNAITNIEISLNYLYHYKKRREDNGIYHLPIPENPANIYDILSRAPNQSVPQDVVKVEIRITVDTPEETLLVDTVETTGRMPYEIVPLVTAKLFDLHPNHELPKEYILERDITKNSLRIGLCISPDVVHKYIESTKPVTDLDNIYELLGDTQETAITKYPLGETSEDGTYKANIHLVNLVTNDVVTLTSSKPTLIASYGTANSVQANALFKVSDYLGTTTDIIPLGMRQSNNVIFYYASGDTNRMDKYLPAIQEVLG